ncbi:glycoside hydrolase family 9 protein [Cohnella suwonensis]|uniref:Endoglucanase n=1 Tax=Cohnella suwonensis TaxID=696072 RepID=A0ABW0LXD1_9BACL
MDYQIFSTISDGWAGDSGFGLETVNSKLPVDSTVTYNGLPSLRINTANPTSPSWLNALITVAGWKAYNFDPYLANGFLEFNIKGDAGGETFLLGFKDRVFERAAGNEITTTVNLNSYVNVTTSWQHVKIPLKDVIQTSQGIDPSSIDSLSIKNNGFQPFKVWLNDIRVTSPDKERVYAPIKVNQLGYPTNGAKQALVTGFEDVLTVDAGTPFTVVNATTNATAYSGTLVLTDNYDDVDSGERIFTADFTSFTTPGQYYVAVQGLQNSPKFTIGSAAALYAPFLNDVTKYFYYQRTGMPITSPYVTNYTRPDFTPDTAVPLMSNNSIIKDVSKGWYDAGDKGKYVNAGAKALSDLLWAYEVMPEKFTDNQFNIPESGNGIPDILDEARWELQWMLKMQDAATGGFYARVTFQDDDNMVEREVIDQDTVSSRTNIKTTADTATAAGVLAHAYLIYQSIDPTFAQQCLNAAVAAWGYLEAHPENIRTPNTGRWPYDTEDDSSNRLWAAGSLYRSTGVAKYNTYFLANYANMAKYFEDPLDFASGWAITWNTGFFSYLKAANPDAGVVSWYATKFQQWFNDKVTRSNASPWNSVVKDGNYYWGITMQIVDTPMEMIIGSKLLGTFASNKAAIDELTYSQLDWILGQNPVGTSFVSGYGDNAVKYPFSIIFRTDNLPGVPKGYLVGGPNRYSNDIAVGNQISRFAAKNYHDNFQEWTTNEHTIYWNSGLVFVAAYSTGSSNNSTISPTTAAFDKNTSMQADIPVTLTLNGNTFTDIKNGTASLVAGTDYTVSGNMITLRKSYLAQQPVGTTNLTFLFSAGASSALSIAVSDSTGNTTIDTSAYYKIASRNSGKLLSVSQGSTADGADVVQWTDNEGLDQQWQFVASSSGYYKLVNRKSGKALDVLGASTQNGGDVIQSNDNGGLSQQWQPVAADTYFKFVNGNSGKVLDVSGASVSDGGNVIQWPDTGGTNQQWQLIKVTVQQQDTQAPSAPSNLSVTDHSSQSVSLQWGASTDNIGVTGYDIYNGSTMAGSTSGTTFTVTGLAAATSYTFTVKAKDAAGNVSATSNAVTVTTDSTNGGTSLVVQYRAADTNASDNQIKPLFNIKNNGTSAVNLSTLKLRYYFSKDGSASVNTWIDWAQIGGENIQRTVTDTYVELSFTSGAGSIAAGGQTGDIQLRMSNSDWSNFNESNDYSFDPTKTAYANWNHVTLYENGTLVWGIEP